MKTMLGCLILLGWPLAALWAEPGEWTTPAKFPPMTFELHVGSAAAVDAPFRDSAGELVTLRRYLGKKPVILNLVFLRCPSLCTEVLNNLVKGLQGLVPSAGKEFYVVTVSIDAREKPALAAPKRKLYIEKYGRRVSERGWAFLTGDEKAIERLTQSVGFHYRWDETLQQFDHPSGLVFLKPDGRIAGYLLGSHYDPNELQARLEEATR